MIYMRNIVAAAIIGMLIGSCDSIHNVKITVDESSSSEYELTAQVKEFAAKNNFVCKESEGYLVSCKHSLPAWLEVTKEGPKTIVRLINMAPGPIEPSEYKELRSSLIRHLRKYSIVEISEEPNVIR